MPFVDLLFRIVLVVLDIIRWTVLVWVVISWLVFFASQTSFRWRYKGVFGVLNQVNDLLGRMAYPFLRPFRRLLRRVDTRGIDWSPLLLLLAIWILSEVVATLRGYILFR
ncbi:MAG: YggT family protein [Acidobacteriota bacterium]